MTSNRIASSTVAACLLTAAAAFCAEDVGRLLAFGVEMAKNGNWREARFRWERAAATDPSDGRVVNNLAVSLEALGDADGAVALYMKALALTGHDVRVDENLQKAKRFQSALGSKSAPVEAPPIASANDRRGRGRSVEVPIRLPLPPRVDITGVGSILVVSFLANETEMLDANRELVRFLRSEFRKRSPLKVLDVLPIPAVPEQTLEDMILNTAFWSRMGREHGADLVVSGMLRYTRRDASGFEDVDVISERTGQKIKQTRFVEQENFAFEVEILFFQGASGELLFRDRFRREAYYRGLSNDPISAFYDLSEEIAGDVLSVVAPRQRDETRLLLKD